MSEIDPNVTVTAEQDGRTLSGVGVTKESLHDTMDARVTVEDTAPASAGPATDATPAPESPKPTRGQARFSELTQQRDAEKARAEAAEKKAQELEARLSQAPISSAPAQPQPVGPERAPSGHSVPSQPPPTRPEPSEDEVGAKYETYGAFVKDQQQWFWEQQQEAINQRVRQGIESHTQATQFQAQIDATREKGRAAYKDFDAMLNGAGAVATQAMPPAAQAFVWQQPNAEHLVYAILRDPVLAQRLTTLSVMNPLAFGLELAKLAPAAPAASPASTGTTGHATPPPPMQPVGSGSTTTKLSSADAETFDVYQARRRAERGGSRRR